MTGSTLIKGADWVVAWDAAAGEHVYLTDADVVFADDRISFVGRGYDGAADVTVDGSGLMVMPGLVNIHAHPSMEPFYRGIREEHGVPTMYMTGLYERAQAFGLNPDDMADAATVAYSELLLSGVTSLCDQSFAYPGWLDAIGKSGLRGFVAPGYSSAHWYMESLHELKYQWDEDQGRKNMDAAIGLMNAADQHESGRLSGVVFPAQIDNCTEEMLRDSIALARETGRPVTSHVAQGVLEFHEIVRRHGVTPVQWANQIGFVGEDVSFGHAIFIDDSSWMNWASHRDLSILVDTATTVAHCPSPFARYGQTLENFGKYKSAGVNLGMGTDVAPHNLIEEMRLATILARVSARDIRAANTADVFHAATVGGAKALLRDDIGRLAPGAKADLILVDLRNEFMQPARDPLRCLVYTAADRAVRDVYVDGRQVVRDGKVLTMDHRLALDRLAEAQARMMRDTPNHDFAKRTTDEISPLSLRQA
ncbi:MAG: amidohydrolase family protein [Alphaproteobacteria bacterium]